MLLRKLALLTVLVAMATCCRASPLFIERTLDKLERYSKGEEPDSGLTKEDLVQLVETWDSMSESSQKLDLQDPLHSLLYYFVTEPTRRILDHLDDATIFEAHLHRIEQAYKRFRPGYLGKVIGDGSTGRLKIWKMVNLYQKLRFHQPVTLKDFEDVRDEFESYDARLIEIFNHEDPYANLDEIQNIMNYYHNGLLKGIHAYAIPLLDEFKDPEFLQKVYYRKLWQEDNLKFVDGILTRFSPEAQQKNNEQTV